MSNDKEDKRFEVIISMDILLADLVKIICKYCGSRLEFDLVMQNINITRYIRSSVRRAAWTSAPTKTYRSAFKSTMPVSKIDFPVTFQLSSPLHGQNQIGVASYGDEFDNDDIVVEFPWQHEITMNRSNPTLTLTSHFDNDKQFICGTGAFPFSFRDLTNDMFLFVASESVVIV
jgi:hypothetical protein